MTADLAYPAHGPAAPVIEVHEAVFRYPAFCMGPASLDVPPGRIRCLLGPNGSGKSTVVNLLVGALQAESGHVRVAGRTLQASGDQPYRHLGFVPDAADDVAPELSAREFWSVCAFAHARADGEREPGAGRRERRRQVQERYALMMARADHLAGRLGFASPPQRPLSEYSHGMRKKAQVVAALLHDPAAIILDEPTNGLDPEVCALLGEVLRECADQGAAVLTASHDLAWVEAFGDDVTVMAQGEVTASGLVRHVLRTAGSATLLEGFLHAVRSGR